LASVSIAGLYSFRAREDFTLVNNKLIIVGPNNSGKSNLIRAITFWLSCAPEAFSRSTMAELKYSARELHNELSLISLQFELDSTTSQFIADALVFPLISQFPVDSIDTMQMEALIDLRNNIKKRIKAIHLVFQEQPEKNSQGEACHESYIAITDKVVKSYVPFFDDDKMDVQQFIIHASGSGSLSGLTVDKSLNSKLRSIATVYDEIRTCLKKILKVAKVTSGSNWLYKLQSIKGINVPESLIKNLIDQHISGDCFELGKPITNRLRSYVAIMPQDRGLISFDRHFPNKQKFTVEEVIQSLTEANLCASKSLEYLNMQKVMKAMKEIGIILRMPISLIQACDVLVKETTEANDCKAMRKRIKSLIEDYGQHVNVKVVCERLLAFLYSPQSDRTAKEAREKLDNFNGIHNVPDYNRQLYSTLEMLIHREVDPNADMNKYNSLQHDIKPDLKKLNVIQFSTCDNPTKALSLGALYGGAQQFLILFTTLLVRNIGTVILDEPEVSLHVSAKAYLKEMLQRLPVSLVIATHAEDFITENTLPSIYHCSRVNAATKVQPINEVIVKAFHPKEPVRAVSHDARPLFFSDRILFVEGTNDSRLLEALLFLVNEDLSVQRKLKMLNIDTNKLRLWTIINLASCDNAPVLCAIAESLVPWLVILDKDALEKKDVFETEQKKTNPRNKKSIAELVHFTFNNKELYKMLDKADPNISLIKKIEDIAEEEEFALNQEENAKTEIIKETIKDQLEQKDKLAALKKEYDRLRYDTKTSKIRNILLQIKQVFAWKGEMEHIFLNSQAANHLHKKCQAEKNEDVDQFILRKAKDALHDLWGHIPFREVVRAVEQLINEENQEFIKLCRTLSKYPEV
jgi:hypothetical protein